MRSASESNMREEFLSESKSRRVLMAPWLALSIACSLVAASPRAALAAAPSPRLAGSGQGATAEALVQKGWANYTKLKEDGVDRIYPQFALDLAKFPRGGVAHRNILVVLCEFPAEGSAPALQASSASTPFYYQRLFFSEDPNDGIISLREYYKINSKGRFIVSGQVTSKWLEMPHSNQYYANGGAGLYFSTYPRSAQKLAEDAMSAAYGDFDNDLDYFDNDGPDGVPSSGDDDGYIDAVCVIHAGVGGETVCTDPVGCGDLWAHEAGIAIYQDCPSPNAACLPGMTLGGVRGFLYFLGGEYNEYPGDRASGTWFHEFGHTLGLPDLYDPSAAGLGFYSLMALGNYLPYTGEGPLGSRAGNLDAWSRRYLGFDEPETPQVAGRYTLPPVSRGGGSLQIWTDGDPGTEYFLAENRIREGSDAYLPGEGMLVYHVDDTEIDNLGGYPNYRVACVQADSVQPLQLESVVSSYGNYGDALDFFPGQLSKRSLTASTAPNSRAYSGANTGVQIYNILGAADGADTASFDLAISLAADIQLGGYRIGDGDDGYADPNEIDSLFVVVRNAGLPSSALTLTLSTGDANVTVGQAGSSAPPLSSDAAAPASAPFVFTVGSIATLPHVIPFTLSWSDGSYAGSFQFTVTVGTAAGLTENFESSAEPGQFWSEGPVAPTTASEWHSSTSRAHTGSRSAKLGSTLALGSGSNEAQTYADLQDAVLTSPTFGVPTGSELVFYSYVDAETNGGTGAWDGGRVEISVEGGAWMPLAVDGGYGYEIEHNSEASLRGADAFSGSPRSWRRVTADLSAYAGEARIRFRFASDDANDPRYSNGTQVRYYEGWYVDDVLVQPRAPRGPTARVLSLRGGPNPYWAGGPSSGSFSFRFSAPDGLPHPGLEPTLRVFDVKGRLVRTLTAAPNPLVPSEFVTAWNAEDGGGQDCAAGIYFANVELQGRSESFRVVLLR